MSNLKDTLSTIAGIMLAIGGVILALPSQGVVLPEWATIAGTVLLALGGAVMGILQGKNADGSMKTAAQIEKQLGDK
jgi:hypothetical protein